ncbi:alpha/beta hydrolase [Streptomyces sp. HPF1205]|uniref:alpha/beta hydrolase n=1 Tax=Streptomyces sp. HPF1205 TaxID=2873262 RepID=UPI001CED9903|nr:alpha/beta fold hydrolase [Streptomyces sp. HPF1205]
MAGGRRLVVRRVTGTGTPRGAVLLLHGGAEYGMRRPSRLSGPSWRMRPFVRALAREPDGGGLVPAEAGGGGLVLAEARYRHRGWNGERADAARDAEEALAELDTFSGGVPVVLVGHSMGGRAALRVAGHERVTGVVALAPWCPPGEPVAQLAGRRLVFAHARADRVTAPEESLRMAVAARAAGAGVCRYLLPGGDHTMLRYAAVWHSLTARAACALLGLAPLPAEAAAAFALPAASPGGLELRAPGAANTM